MKFNKTGYGAAQKILAWTTGLLSRFPTRIPGSGNSAAAGRAIAADMRRFCESVKEEAFVLHPGALFNVGRVLSVVYALSLVLFMTGGICTYISFLLVVLTFTYAFSEYFLYSRFFDPLFEKRRGINAFGVLEPSLEVRQQVILCGHHDGAYEFGFFRHLKRLAGIRFLLGIVFYLYLVGLSFYAVLQSSVFLKPFVLSGAYLIIALAGLLFTLPLFYFVSGRKSPGAGDNANGSSIAMEVTRHFAREKSAGRALLHTRLVVLSTDGEEAGQRGAIDYAKKREGEFAVLPTYVFNIDSVYNVKDLAVMSRDRHGFQRLSKRMARDIMHIAGQLGYTLQDIILPFGSGTDAAAFAMAGAEAVSIIGMSASLFDGQHVYHTQNDVVSAIDPEAVEAVYNIAINYIRMRDGACP